MLQFTNRLFNFNTRKLAYNPIKINATSNFTRVNRTRDSLDLTFTDYRTAFKSKTTGELCRALLVYTLCSSNYLVDNNISLMNKTQKMLGKRLFSLIMKLSFYGHFVAGSNEQDIKSKISRLSSFGVHSILDYSVEEDLSQEEGQKIDFVALAPEGPPQGTSLPKFRTNPSFPDRRYKVRSARTYFYLNEATCEKNMETFMRCLEAAHDSGGGYVAIKITALGRPQLLLQLSEIIVKAQEFIIKVAGPHMNASKEEISTNLRKHGVSSEEAVAFLCDEIVNGEGLVHILPWSGIIDRELLPNDAFLIPNATTIELREIVSNLTKKDKEMLRNMIRRVSSVIQAAVNLNVSVLIDAEQSYLQTAISRLAVELMEKFNKNRPVVYNTYQCYLKDTYDVLTEDIYQSQRQNFYFGAKLVRGAYLEQERDRAEALSYDDPTNPTYDATTAMYHMCLAECLRLVRKLKDERCDPQRISVMVASHNEDTVRFAIEKMLEIGVRPEDNVVSFGQLYGMCDYVSFPLGQSGFSVYKYMPYGPINEVLPYLSRRVYENRGLLKNVRKEKSLLRKELVRRVVSLQLFKKPVGFYNPA